VGGLALGAHLLVAGGGQVLGEHLLGLLLEEELVLDNLFALLDEPDGVGHGVAGAVPEVLDDAAHLLFDLEALAALFARELDDIVEILLDLEPLINGVLGAYV